MMIAKKRERTPTVPWVPHPHVLLRPRLAGSAGRRWRRRRREGSDDLHFLCETARTVEEDAAHLVHVHLRGEPALAVVVGPPLALSLDHHNELLTTPAFTASARAQNGTHHVDVSHFPYRGRTPLHSQVVCIVRHLDRLLHNGLFTAVDRSHLKSHRRHGGGGCFSVCGGGHVSSGHHDDGSNGGWWWW